MRKNELNEHLENNTKIPHHLRKDAKDLLDDMIYNEDEENIYKWPNVFVTTSHTPSNFLKSFVKHFSLIFNGKFIPRANMSQDDLADFATKNNCTHLFILNEAKGKLRTVILSLFPGGKTYYFTATQQFVAEYETMKQNAYLICDGLKSEKIGQQLLLDIRLMFPSIKSESDKKEKMKKINKECRVVSFINKGGILTFKHFIVKKRIFKLDMSVDLNIYKVTNGTFNMDGDVEYQIGGYKNIVEYNVL